VRHETVCTLYELAEAGRRWEASEGLPLTPVDELVTHLKDRLFGVKSGERKDGTEVWPHASNLPR
jgi:hypothetical protein